MHLCALDSESECSDKEHRDREPRRTQCSCVYRMPSATAQTESVETEGVETERVETERGGHLVVHQLFQAPHVQDQPRPALQQTGAKRLVVSMSCCLGVSCCRGTRRLSREGGLG